MDRKHSRESRAAVVYAVEELGLTSAQVAALAAAGELKTSEGHRIRAFEIAESTVRNYCRLARDRARKAADNGHEEVVDRKPATATVERRRKLARPCRPSTPPPKPQKTEHRPWSTEDLERLPEDSLIRRLVREANEAPQSPRDAPPASGVRLAVPGTLLGLTRKRWRVF